MMATIMKTLAMDGTAMAERSRTSPNVQAYANERRALTPSRMQSSSTSICLATREVRRHRKVQGARALVHDGEDECCARRDAVLQVGHDPNGSDARQPRGGHGLNRQPLVLPPPPISREKDEPAAEHRERACEDKHGVAHAELVRGVLRVRLARGDDGVVHDLKPWNHCWEGWLGESAQSRDVELISKGGRLRRSHRLH